MTHPQPAGGHREPDPHQTELNRYISSDLGAALQVQRILYADLLARLDADLAIMAAELEGGVE